MDERDSLIVDHRCFLRCRCEVFNLVGRKVLLAVLQFLVCREFQLVFFPESLAHSTSFPAVVILLIRIIALYQPRRRWKFLMIAVLFTVYAAVAAAVGAHCLNECELPADHGLPQIAGFTLRPVLGTQSGCTIPSVSNTHR